MRKKIFIIHGKGERDGIGKNAGGDLDTISSNVFYGAWAEATVAQAKGAPAVYGEDYEFDFVNYQQGLSHLAVHRGCDIYLPDFPIDALPPRLRLQRITNPCEITVRKMLADGVRAFLPAAFACRAALSPEEKERVNELQTKALAVLDKRGFCEIGMMAFALWFTTEALHLRAAGDAAVQARLDEVFSGATYAKLRDTLQGLLSNPLKKNLLEQADQKNTRLKLLLDDSVRADYGITYRNQHGGQLAPTWTEAVAALAEIGRLLLEAEPDLLPADRDALRTFARGIEQLLRGSIAQVRDLFTALAAALPGEAARCTAAAHYTAAVEEFLTNLPQYVALERETGTARVLRAMLVEEASGAPVAGIAVRFRLARGDGELAVNGMPCGAQAEVVSGDDGGVTVELRLPAPDARYEVFATHDDMVLLPWRDSATLYELSGGADDTGRYQPDHVSSATVSDEADTDDDEGGTLAGDLAVGMACRLIERDIRTLAAADVRLVRVDDHHPYTPEILATLQRLQGEGLLEKVNLCSRPRGEEQPKEQQQCGADLIYANFVKGQAGDNPGLALLCELAHVQDLHIRADDLAIDLSKLLGSKVDKIAMTRALMRVRTAADLQTVMAREGWAQRVAEYEAALEKICPRLDATLSCIQFLIPPPDGNYGKDLGWKSVFKPFVGMGKDEAAKQRELKKLYAEKPEHSVRIFTALAPFCDGKKGEPQINVASVINYLKPRYNPDYFFYHYGGFLMTTRRVSGESHKLDLNRVVSTIGSKADGGHAEAASGRPSSNPAFPLHRFEDVKDKNYQEYLCYLAAKLQPLTGLELYRVGPVPAEKLPEATRQAVMRAARCCALLTVKGKQVLFVLHQYPATGEPPTGLPLVRDYLTRVIPCDYLVYAYGVNQWVFINHDDREQTLALDELARALGTYRDGGSRVAADCQPKYHPDFPCRDFKYANAKAFALLAGYFAACVQRHYPEEQVVLSAPAVSFDAQQQPIAARAEKNLAFIDFHTAAGVSPRRSFRVFCTLAPFTDRAKGEPDLGALTAASYLRSTGKDFDFFLYAEGSYRGTFIAMKQEPVLDLAAILQRIEASIRVHHGPVIHFAPTVPAAMGKVNYRNFHDYLTWLGAAIGEASGFGLQTVTALDRH